MSSSINVAWRNLITLMTTSFANAGNPDWGVWAGPLAPNSQYVAPLTFNAIGGSGTQRPAELGINYKREEEFVIECEIYAWQGGGYSDPMVLMDLVDQAFTMWGTVTVAIANDPSLTGVPGSSMNSPGSAVRFAQIKSMVFDAGGQAGLNTDPVVYACIRFDVHCEARITSLDATAGESP